jgi:hypothetical protein
MRDLRRGVDPDDERRRSDYESDFSNLRVQQRACAPGKEIVIVEAEAQQREATRKIHEALGVSLFKRPPKGFDPLKASERESLVYGYPPRPDREIHAELHDLWVDMVSRPWTIVEPRFAVRADLRHRQIPEAATATWPNWSGSVAYSPLVTLPTSS